MISIISRGVFYYCDSCGSFTQKEPSENMLKLMERIDVRTWTLGQICEKCRAIGEEAPKVKDNL